MRSIQNRLYDKTGYSYIRAASYQLGDYVNSDTDPTNADPATNSDGTQTYNGIKFDPRQSRTFALGLVAGLQYTNITYGKCFIALAGTLDFLDYFQSDLAMLFQELNFFSLVVYDPVHFTGNLYACYE